jgi:hypothetical protein
MFDQHHGATPADTAKKCFADNLRRYGNAQTNPEKFNLYNGLTNLAVAVEDIQSRITTIEAAVAHIASRLQ